jgi:hypothetical protein
MIPHNAMVTPRPLPGFTLDERLALRTLGERYHQGHDLCSVRELAHLRFLRWLYETSRVVS